MMYCKVCVTEDWPTSVGLLKEAVTYAIPQEVYMNEIHGKVGHTNHGLCLASDATATSKPTLPAILDPDTPPSKPRSHHKK